jgi:hypothetical protein
VTGDPRQPDVEEAQALLDQVERDDAVRLPAVSAAELATLGALQGTLIDDDAWSWWIDMPEAERYGLAAMALKFLVHRGLVDPPGPDAGQAEGTDEVALRVRPLLAMILAGRSQPAFVAVRRDGARSSPDRMRLYGIAEEGSGLKAVLAEEATGKHAAGFGPGYQYALVSPAEAATSLVRWIKRSPGRLTIGRRPVKVIDVYRPNTGAGPTLAHLKVTPASGGFRVERDGDDAPVEGDEDLLGRLLADLLAGRTP